MRHATPPTTTIIGGFMLAFILGMTANKLRIPPLVGYLLVDVLAGLFIPGFVADTKLAPELAEPSAIPLMFSVGLYFSLKDLMAVESIAIPGAITQITVATLLGMTLSVTSDWSLMIGIALDLCLSTADTVVLLRAPEKRQFIDSQCGQTATGRLIVEGLVMVLTPVLLLAITGMAEKGDVGFASLALDFGIIIGKVVAFIAIMMLVGRRLVPWIMSRSTITGSRELFILSVLALALDVAFDAVELFSVSFVLGASFAGMVLNEPELSHRTTHDTLPLCDTFAVLFFASVGVLFNPIVLVQQPLAALAILTITIFGKSAAALFLVCMFGYSSRTALTIAASLTQTGESAFILAGLGMALNLLLQVGQNLVPTGAIISVILNPVLFTLLEKYLDKAEILDEQTLERVSEDEKQVPVDICNYALLVDFGRVGGLPDEKLMAQGIPLAVVETPRTHVDELRECGISTVLGNATDEEIVELAHLDCARWLLLTIPSGYEAGEIVASAREKYPNIEIIARVHYDGEVDYIIDHRANQVMMDERRIAHIILQLLETPPADEVVTD